MALVRPPIVPVWANTGDKIQPTDPELEVGWPVTDIPPARERFNWAFNWFTNGIRYLTRRGVPDWVATETYEIGDRCIGDDGKTYKAILQNLNFAPSTNPLKWERWGFTLSELMVVLFSGIHGGNCPVTGPAAAPTLANPFTRYTSVTPCFEEWCWTGVAWKVVSGYYRYGAFAGSVNMGVGTVINLMTSPAVPRAGKVRLHGVISNLNNVAGGNILQGYFVLTRAGAPTTVLDSLCEYTAISLNQYMQSRPTAPTDVLAGDTITLVGINANGGSLAPSNGNALYYQYV